MYPCLITVPQTPRLIAFPCRASRAPQQHWTQPLALCVWRCTGQPVLGLVRVQSTQHMALCACGAQTTPLNTRVEWFAHRALQERLQCALEGWGVGGGGLRRRTLEPGGTYIEP